MSLSRTLCCLGALAVAGQALAHGQAGLAGGLASGFMHPLGGLDHMVAMVAVGLWGAELGMPAIWLLPVVFPLLMSVGGVLGIAGVPLPATELVIGLSGLALGIAITARWRAPLRIAVVMVAVFAVFHGHAHGMELPGAASPLGYGMGFVVSTGLLHLSGIALGVLAMRPGYAWAYRATGALIALTGAYFCATALHGVI